MLGTRINIDVDIDNLVDAQNRLTSIQRRLRDFTPMFVWAHDELKRANAKNFSENGLPVGGWAPLSPKYEKWKAAKDPSPPMQRKGQRLFRSLTSLAGPPNSISRMSATFGTEVDYAEFHQYGTRKMPKRQVVYEPVDFARELGEHSVRYLAEGTLPGLMFGGVV